MGYLTRVLVARPWLRSPPEFIWRHAQRSSTRYYYSRSRVVRIAQAASTRQKRWWKRPLRPRISRRFQQQSSCCSGSVVVPARKSGADPLLPQVRNPKFIILILDDDLL